MMHVEGSQIDQNNLWNNSYQNMYAVGNNWPFGQENRFCAKKTPQNRPCWWTRIWVTWLGKALDGERLTPGQLQAYPWKLGGMTVQTSYVGG